MPAAGVHHLVPAVVGDCDLEAAKVAVLAPGAFALVPEAPSDVALAGDGAVHRRLVVEEGNGLERAEVESLNSNTNARVGAVYGSVAGGGRRKRRVGGVGGISGGVSGGVGNLLFGFLDDGFGDGGGGGWRRREGRVLRRGSEVFAGFEDGGVDSESGIL